MLRDFLQGPFKQHMSPSLVEVNRCGWKVSIHQDKCLNLLWVRDIRSRNGRSIERFSRTGQDAIDPSSFVRIGGTNEGQWRSIGGKLPTRVARAEGYCDDGLPVTVSVEQNLFCAIMPRFRPVVLRFWEEDEVSVREYIVDKEIDIEKLELYQPWRGKLAYWIRNLVKPNPKGVATYGDRYTHERAKIRKR